MCLKKRRKRAISLSFAGIILLNIFCLFISPLSLTAQEPDAQQRLKQYNLEAGKPAIDGYDPVSYFKAKKPVKGSSSFSTTYGGVQYRFSSAANLELFRKNPSGYEPQYGGWCAYAMGNDGSKVEVDPETFRILDGKLYLFYNSFFNNTLKTWLKDESALKTKADQHWQRYAR